MDRNTYCYIVYTCNAIKAGHQGRLYSFFIYKTDMESNPSGIPTMGEMEGRCRRGAARHGVKYIENSLVVLNIMRITKRQYEQLQSGEDNSTWEFQP